MGNKLFRQCWDVQEEHWQNNYQYEFSETSDQYYYSYQYLFGNNSNFHPMERQSI
ncbi:hypothetical protein I4U23_021766 [Adineta vaga]|nr:hypothetical protein I4U23_021766 [Adineta vaga]